MSHRLSCKKYICVLFTGANYLEPISKVFFATKNDAWPATSLHFERKSSKERCYSSGFLPRAPRLDRSLLVLAIKKTFEMGSSNLTLPQITFPYYTRFHFTAEVIFPSSELTTEDIVCAAASIAESA